MSPKFLLLKLVMTLFLLGGLALFGFGALLLADELVFRVTSVPVRGEVVGERDRIEKRVEESRTGGRKSWEVTVDYPIVRFRSPVDGLLHRVESTRRTGSDEQPGAMLELRASTRDAGEGRAPHFSQRHLLPAALLLGGLFVLALVTLTWHLTDESWGGETSIPRLLRPLWIWVTLGALPAVLWGAAPELTKCLMLDRDALAAAMRAEPPGPGQLLSPTERRIARLPVYGPRAAAAAVELAIEERRYDDLRRYLRAHRDPAIRFPLEGDDFAPFFRAVSGADIDAIRILIEEGLDPRREAGLTKAAVWSKRADIVTLLAANGVAPEDATAVEGVAIYAVGEEDLLLAVLQAGWIKKEPFPPTRMSLLDHALRHGMVRSSAELERRGFATGIPFLARLVQGDLAGMRAAYPEAKWVGTKIDDAPLLAYAAYAGQLAVVRRLVELGADPAERSVIYSGPEKTALDWAAENGRVDVVRYLASLPGAQAYLAPKDQDPPIFHAAAAGQWDVVRFLVDAGASPNVHKRGEPNWDETPLHFAAREGNVAAVAYLLAHGADPLAEAAEKLLPVEVAKNPAVRAAIEAAGGRGP